MSIWQDVNKIAENLLSVYEQLHELSHEVGYICEDQTLEEGYAGDNMKLILADMMDEIQKLKPVNY